MLGQGQHQDEDRLAALIQTTGLKKDFFRQVSSARKANGMCNAPGRGHSCITASPKCDGPSSSRRPCHGHLPKVCSELCLAVAGEKVLGTWGMFASLPGVGVQLRGAGPLK